MTVTAATDWPQWFDESAVWNVPLPPDAPLDSNSANLITEVASQAASAASFNYKSFTTGIFDGDTATGTASIHFDQNFTTSPQLALADACSAVPIPADAKPDLGNETAPYVGASDRHMVIYQPSTDTLWELFDAHHYETDGCPYGYTNPGWHASWGGVIQNVSQSSGIFGPDSYPGASTSWGSTATSLPLIAGMITREEALAQYIPHALSCGMMCAASNNSTGFRWPAQRGDGTLSGSNRIQQGSILRLPPNFDPATVTDAFLQSVATAIRDYGMIVNDTSSAVSIRCESRIMVDSEDIWLGANQPTPPSVAFHGVFSTFPSVLLPALPWSQMQVVDASYRPELKLQPTSHKLKAGTFSEKTRAFRQSGSFVTKRRVKTY